MKDLVRAPALLSLLLSFPLWIVFGNYIVALIVALLAAFLIAMCHSLLVLKRQPPKQQDNTLPHNDANTQNKHD